MARPRMFTCPHCKRRKYQQGSAVTWGARVCSDCATDYAKEQKEKQEPKTKLTLSGNMVEVTLEKRDDESL